MNVFTRKKYNLSILRLLNGLMLVLFVSTILVNLLFFPNTMGLSFMGSSISSYGVINYPDDPANGIVFWGIHEPTNNLAEWNVKHVTDNLPDAGITVVDFQGERWVRSEIFDNTEKTRADVARYDDVRDELDAWWGWKLYFPSDFESNSNDHCTVAQLHARADAGKFMTLTVSQEGTFEIITDLNKIPKITLAEGIPIITGRPFNLVVHLIIAEDGLLDVWIDGEWVLHYTRDFRVTAGDPNKRDGASIMVGLYQGAGVGEHYMLFRDVVCATTKEKVLEFLNS